MTPKTSKNLTGTGPLAPHDLGHFTFRDGVWFIEPKAATPPRRKP